MKNLAKGISKLVSTSAAIVVIAALFLSCSSGSNDDGPQTNSDRDNNSQVQYIADTKSGQPTSKASVKGAMAAPAFSLPDLDGNTIEMSDYSGKVLLVDFWATWCPPCRMSIPVLADLHQKYADQGFSVIGVSLDTKPPSEVAQFARNFQIPYPIIMGDLSMARDWNLGSGIPVAYLVDRNGNVVSKSVGYKDFSYYDKLIKQYL